MSLSILIHYHNITSVSYDTPRSLSSVSLAVPESLERLDVLNWV